MGPSSPGIVNAGSLRASHLQSTASFEMHRYITAQALMADALNKTAATIGRRSAAGTGTSGWSNNSTPLDPNAPLEPFTPYTPSEAGRRLLQRYKFDRLQQRDRKEERDARSASTSANPNSSSFRPGFPPPPTKTVGPTTISATTAAAAAAWVVAEQNKYRNRNERLMSLQSHMSRGHRVRFGSLIGGTAAGSNNSSNNTRSSSGASPSGASNAQSQHQHPLTWQNFQHWYSTIAMSVSWRCSRICYVVVEHGLVVWSAVPPLAPTTAPITRGRVQALSRRWRPTRRHSTNTLQNFQRWYSMQSDASGWAGAGGDGLGAGAKRGRGGRTARVLGNYMVSSNSFSFFSSVAFCFGIKYS